MRSTVEDIRAWEAANVEDTEWSIILFQTGIRREMAGRRSVFRHRSERPEASTDLHFPGLHHDTVKWLVENRKFKAVGIDTASIDRANRPHSVARGVDDERLFRRSRTSATSGRLPVKGFQIVAMPHED
jgi:kynurenine formamidase